MCAVTLPNNQKDKVACEKLAVLLSVRLFVELDKHKDFDIDSRSQAIGSKIAIGIKFLMAIIHKKRLYIILDR